MDRLFKTTLAGLVFLSCMPLANAHPTVGSTTKIGPFVGPGQTFHSGNQSPQIEFIGTDLGWSYVHDGDLKFLFGDTHADADESSFELIDPNYGSDPAQYDDGFGTVDLDTWDDPSAFSSSNIPTILLGQHSGQVHAKALNPGHWSDAFKTPFGGWSNGSREYALFYSSKQEGCKYDTDCDNQLSDLTCDQGIGFWWEEYYDEKDFTGVCIDGSAWWCLNDTMVNIFGWPISGTGFCTDETSTVYDTDDVGRLLSFGVKHRIGIRNTSDERQYDNIKVWLTNKFRNISIATAQDFQPADGSGAGNQDYNVAGSSGSYRRVFLWGRPNFIGIDANDRNMGLYFAYVDMPTGSTFSWTVHYYTGTSGGVPQFDTDESAAAALDLDADTGGIQEDEVHDNISLYNVIWIDHLEKWVMLYGGSVSTVPNLLFGTCGVLEFFVGYEECEDVDLEDGAIYMRTADDPWGPWSPPVEFYNPGDPYASPPTGEYANNGMLYHPDCSGANCAENYVFPNYDPEAEFGVIYSPIIHTPWIETVGDDVDVIWSVSTWNPYGIHLMRTRIEAD